MHVEKGPICGAWELCNLRNQLTRGADVCRSAFRNCPPRTRWAAGSAKPDEIHCCVRQCALFCASRFRFQRHSTTSPDDGKIPMRRKGLMRFSGNSLSLALTNLAESAAPTALTTSPRLMVRRRATLWLTEYQFINARDAPLSFSAIHVPPPGSEGQRTARPFVSLFAGGKPPARVSFSSRFIPRQ